MGVEELKAYLANSGISAEILELEDEVKTVNQAAKALGVPKGQIIKTIMFIDALGEPVLAIVRGDQKVDNKKLANVIGTIGVRMASAKEVKKTQWIRNWRASPNRTQTENKNSYR